MKISKGTGTPIWVSSRDNGNGAIVHQGTSHLLISAAEIGPVIAALQALTPSNESTCQ